MIDYKNEFINDEKFSKMNCNKKALSNKDINNNNIKSINKENNEDDRLMYILITLGLGSLIQTFNDKNISFTDLLLLSKESLKDLGLEMYQRNRIYNFSTTFNRNAKTYSIKEISEFFSSNKQFLFSPTIYNKMMQLNKNSSRAINKSVKNRYYENEYKYFSDGENNYTSKRTKNKNYNFSPGSKSYKASKIFKKYLLIKKGVDAFLNKLNKQKEDTENISYKFNNMIKKISNPIDYNNINNFEKNQTKKIKTFNSYNINDDNEDLILIPEEKALKNNLNKNLDEEKVRNDEYNKLIEKLNKLEQMKIDENSYENLNQIKNYINEKGKNFSVDEIISLQKEIEKIAGIISKKEKLKQNLEKYSKKIEQRKKIIYKLENEYNGINYENYEEK